MKNIITYLFFFLALISCEQTKKLNTDETKLIQEINLDQEIAEKIKGLSTGVFEVSKGNKDRDILFEDFQNLKNYSKNLPKAIKIKATAENASRIVKRFKQVLKDKKLIVYKSAENHGNQDDIITILQSDNKFEALIFEATNGVNYDIHTQLIIDRLKDWDSKYGIELDGVGGDFVSGEFKNKPTDIPKFTKEMYDFCPDIVEQGVGSIKGLENTLKESNQFFLWWD